MPGTCGAAKLTLWHGVGSVRREEKQEPVPRSYFKADPP